jgi:hypothetical protein
LKSKTLYRFFFLALFIFPFSLAGMGQVNDAGLWTEFTVKKKITKRFDAVLTEELRFNENITELGTYYTDIGAEYEILNGFKAGAFYRFLCKRRLDDSYSKAHRYYFDLSYGNHIKRFGFSYRIRFQSQYKDYHSSLDGHVPGYYIRQKLHLGINTKTRFDPYLDGEVWYHLNNPWSQFEAVRISAGVVTRITRHHFVDTGYIYQQEFNVNDPETDYIIFLGYKFLF